MAANFAELLAKRANSLNQVTQVHDASVPKIKTFAESEEDFSSYQSIVLDLNIEEWIELVQDLTFPTSFLPFSIEDAALFRDAYTEGKSKSRDEFSQELKQRLQTLENYLQEGIDKMRDQTSDCVFIKTSSRSAKDSPTTIQNLKAYYKEALAKSAEKDENARIICLLEAQRRAFMVRTAAEAISSFVSSERIFQDMQLALKHPDRFRENFVIRKWVDIDSDMEFRGFCHKGQFTALSQYHHFCYFPRLTELENHIVEIITNFFEKEVKHRVTSKLESFIIDFALTGPDLDKVWIIELNPFLETTDGCLFSWQKERAKLENGPFEFRFNKRKVLGSRSMIGQFWREILDSADE